MVSGNGDLWECFKEGQHAETESLTNTKHQGLILHAHSDYFKFLVFKKKLL